MKIQYFKKSALALAMLLSTGEVLAQLGQDESQCGKVWGRPVSGQLDADGNGTLTYSSRNVTIELDYVSGIVLNARYRKDEINEKDVDSLLRLNNNKEKWEVWTVPGIPASEQKSSQWMRSDEAAMAELQDGVLRIDGPPPIAELVSDVQPSKQVEVASKKAKTLLQPKAEPSGQPKKTMEKKEVATPELLPAVGDTKTRVLQILGDPSGTMVTGGKEILVYAWGNIWVAEGRVISVN